MLLNYKNKYNLIKLFKYYLNTNNNNAINK